MPLSGAVEAAAFPHRVPLPWGCLVQLCLFTEFVCSALKPAQCSANAQLQLWVSGSQRDELVGAA